VATFTAGGTAKLVITAYDAENNLRYFYEHLNITVVDSNVYNFHVKSASKTAIAAWNSSSLKYTANFVLTIAGTYSVYAGSTIVGSFSVIPGMGDFFF